MEDIKSPTVIVASIEDTLVGDDKLLSVASGLTSCKSPMNEAANQGDDLVVGDNDAEGGQSHEKVEDIPKKPLRIPCDFYEFQQMHWRSEIILDEFDEDNVPYTPNLHKMWVRHCQRLQKLNDEDEGSSPSQNVEDHQTPTLPGFHYRPETGDVVYDDGNDLLSVSGGTWILNDKDELVSGPVPLSSSSMMHQSHGGLNVNPFPNYAIDQSHSEGGNSKMRNRCYSDNQNGNENVDYSSSCKSSNDSGIDIEGELDHIASQEEFKPPLNSTPQRNGGNPVCSSVPVPLFLRKFQMLGLEETQFKREEEGKEDANVELEDGTSPVVRLL